MDRPLVGVAILLQRDKSVLLGLRKGGHGKGTWCPPGGHLEFNEEVEACALRELAEETGLSARNLRPGPYTNNIFRDENKHSITLFLYAEYAGGTARVREPDKCERWEWFAWDALPEPLFLPFALLTQKQSGHFLPTPVTD